MGGCASTSSEHNPSPDHTPAQPRRQDTPDCRAKTHVREAAARELWGEGVVPVQESAGWSPIPELRTPSAENKLEFVLVERADDYMIDEDDGNESEDVLTELGTAKTSASASAKVSPGRSDECSDYSLDPVDMVEYLKSERVHTRQIDETPYMERRLQTMSVDRQHVRTQLKASEAQNTELKLAMARLEEQNKALLEQAADVEPATEKGGADNTPTQKQKEPSFPSSAPAERVESAVASGPSSANNEPIVLEPKWKENVVLQAPGERRVLL